MITKAQSDRMEWLAYMTYVGVEVQSNFKSRIRYSYGNLTQITVPSVFTGCNLTNKKLSRAMEINITISCSALHGSQ